MLRRTLATVAVTAIAVVGLAPAASAQLPGGDAISRVDCGHLNFTLRALNLKDDNTTRSQLARNIRDEAAPFTLSDPSTWLVSVNYAEQIADRALECGIVKPDPQDPFAGSTRAAEIIQEMSSALARQN